MWSPAPPFRGVPVHSDERPDHEEEQRRENEGDGEDADYVHVVHVASGVIRAFPLFHNRAGKEKGPVGLFGPKGADRGRRLVQRPVLLRNFRNYGLTRRPYLVYIWSCRKGVKP